MGKGKGTFEFWATRCVTLYTFVECSGAELTSFSVNKGRVIFEIGGVPIREELARDGTIYSPVFPSTHDANLGISALRQASARLPTTTEFIHRSAPPRLGNMLIFPPKPIAPESSALKQTVNVS